MKHPVVYIMASQRNGTIYTGLTSELIQRIHQHRTATTGFTAQHNCKRLPWFEQHETMESAITREKQIKAGSRKPKLKLIETTNPHWRDLYPNLH